MPIKARLEVRGNNLKYVNTCQKAGGIGAIIPPRLLQRSAGKR